MPTYLAQGWLPIDFDMDPEPALVPGGVVCWREFGQTPLSEPFFRQTIERMNQLASPPTDIHSSLESMLRISDGLPAIVPHGFIFHVSHCGSTVITNALKRAADTVVAAEARPFLVLARHYFSPPTRYLNSRWAERRRRLFESLFRLYAHYRTGTAEKLIVKFASSNLFGMKFVREVWPDVPSVLIVRDPAEVLVSSLGENGWLSYKNDPLSLRDLYGWIGESSFFENMPSEEFCARLLGRHLTAALEAVDDRCKVIDYENLNRTRISEIARFFGVELSAASEELNQVFTIYSKDPTRTLAFRNDRALKQRMASPAVTAAARQFAMPAYIELRGRGAL
ncbi:MAG TPA: hypothetical protein VG672_01955 [Bryobacteraceae bacterium]|nr:hypothetical protein [Bryobacteraceae bacterium]